MDLFILCYSMFLMFMSACYNELETVDFEEQEEQPKRFNRRWYVYNPITWIRYFRCGRVEVRLSLIQG